MLPQPSTPRGCCRPSPDDRSNCDAFIGSPAKAAKIRKVATNNTGQQLSPEQKSKQEAVLQSVRQQVAARHAQLQVPSQRSARWQAAEAQRQAMEAYQLQQQAVASLRPDGFCGRLPCREDEQERIASHLRMAVKQGGSMQVLYISGMPGTGKTASVKEVIEQMRNDKALPAFSVAHVNAMRLSTPGAVFREIFRQLPQQKNSRCSASCAHGELIRFFSQRSAQDPIVILLVDEIDHLITQNQAVLYKLFDWLALPAPRLVLAAISNTMDLPERLLPRVASRFGIVRVDFEPYNRDQIFQILTERLQSRGAVDCFSPVMLRLCAARVAAGSGDIRKALQLCRRAAEVQSLAPNASGPVNLPHLEIAEKDLLHSNPATKAISGLSSKTRHFLLALLMELRSNKEVDSASLQSVALRYRKLRAALSAAAADGAGASKGADEEAASSLLQLQPSDEVSFLAQRLQAMALLMQQRPATRGAGRTAACAVAAAAVGPRLALGAGLDTEDLATALKAAETDDGILELLRERGPM